MQLSVMTFNLRRQTTKDGGNAWTFRKTYAADIVKRYRPTVAGTQEGFREMLTDLEQQLPGYAWIGEGRNEGSADEHNAILYLTEELEVADWGQFWLSEHPEGPVAKCWGASHHRICTWAHFRSRQDPDRQFLHYNTHLDHSSQEAREKGVRLLWQRLSDHRARTGLPVLLTGDMNAEPDNPAIAYLRGQTDPGSENLSLTDAYSILPEPPGTSFHSFEGGADGEPIDYIFGTSEVRFDDVCIIRDQYDGIYPSDHYPVAAKATLSGSPVQAAKREGGERA